MATNYLQAGNTVEYTCTGAVTKGDPIGLPAVGAGQKFIGIAEVSGVTGDVITLMTEGVFSITKVAAAGAWVVGDDVYLTSSKTFTETATANGYAGVAWEAATTTATTGKVRINFGGDPR